MHSKDFWYGHTHAHAHRIVLSHIQMSCYAACAVTHLVALIRWRKRGRELNDARWQQFGRFTGLSCLVGVFGVFVYAARIGNLVFIYRTRRFDRLSSPSIEDLELRATLRSRWFLSVAVFFGLAPLELFFVAAVYLLVLYRMLRLAVVSSTQERTWMLCARVFMAVVATANLIGICGNIVTSVFFFQASDFALKEAKAWSMNDTAAALTFSESWARQRTSGTSTAAVQRFCQVFVMLMTITAFSVVVWSFRRFILSALRALFIVEQKIQERALTCDIISQGSNSHVDQNKMVAETIFKAKHLQHKATLTFVFTFMAASLRSFYDVLYAIAQSWNDNQNPCSLSPCNPCHNVYSNIHGWLLYTPEFESCVMIIASPAALLVALWGMSDVHEIEQMSSPAAKLRFRFRQLRSQL
jgi:hypothetical protein